MSHVRIATRASRLALWQADHVAGMLHALGHTTERIEVLSEGDKSDAPLGSLGTVGIFTKAVQDAVLTGDADLAVHSYKDLPSAPTDGLHVAAVPTRADARDAIVAPAGVILDTQPGLPLAGGVRVGTGAARRRAQLAQLRPDVQAVPMRGNLDTRLRKLREGQADALLLAMAGLERLKPDLTGLHVMPLEPDVFMPAPAQGALALEIRRSDDELDRILSDLHDVQGHPAIAAERGLMAMLEGGCQLELGAHARKQDGRVHLAAWYRGRRAEAHERNAEEAAMRVYQILHTPEGDAA